VNLRPWAVRWTLDVLSFFCTRGIARECSINFVNSCWVIHRAMVSHLAMVTYRCCRPCPPGQCESPDMLTPLSGELVAPVPMWRLAQPASDGAKDSIYQEYTHMIGAVLGPHLRAFAWCSRCCCRLLLFPHKLTHIITVIPDHNDDTRPSRTVCIEVLMALSQ
jgi:hypothetical protein